MKRDKAGISLIEGVFVLLLLAILAAAVLPRFQMGAVRQQTAKTLARQIAADLRYTRQLALTNAADNPDGYELVMNGSGSYTGYTIRNRQNGQTLQTSSIATEIQCTGGRTFSYSPLGSLTGDTALHVAAGNRQYAVTIFPTTGSVLCREIE